MYRKGAGGGSKPVAEKREGSRTMSVQGQSLRKVSPEKAEKNGTAARSRQSSPVNPKEVLLELFELLEAYSPVWYTPQHHQRASAALRVLYGRNHPPRPRISICQA